MVAAVHKRYNNEETCSMAKTWLRKVHEDRGKYDSQPSVPLHVTRHKSEYRLNLRLGKAWCALVRKAARNKGITPSELVKRLVINHLTGRSRAPDIDVQEVDNNENGGA